jgi:hypothetical protein
MKRLVSSTLLVSLFTACGVGLEPEAPVRAASPLERAFDDASRQYQVPVAVLKAVGFVETRLSTQANLESGSGGVGVMQLARRGDVDTLARAAQLTGVTEGRLRVDPVANILGAAAVLRELFDSSHVSQPTLDASEVGDWYVAVSHYPGFDSAMVAADYATDVFLNLEAGFEVEGREGVLTQRPVASAWRNHAPVQSARRDAVVEYPGAVGWVASPNYSSGRTSYEFVLIHTMQGSYAGTKSWFQNSSSNVSSHYIVRSSDGQVTQMVEHRNTAWHAQCYNGRSIGIEHEGFVQDPARWYTDAMYRESARLTRWIADRHNIPKTRARIIGHVEVPRACNTGGHTDPGSGWNWTKYLQLVTGSAPTTSSGVLIGAIYTGGSTSNRVSGATVTVGTQTVTTGADGLYQFTLAPGSYTATVTRSGFATATVTRTVTSGTQTWGSVGLSTTSMADTQPPQVAITFPGDLATLDLGRIELRGTASDDRGAVASVKVALNGGTASDVAVTNGAFAVEVQLQPGTNTFTVSATDAANNTGRATSTATFNAGVAGFIHLVDMEATRIADATVELREASSGTLVTTATSDASGAYFAPVMVVPADYLVVVRKTGFLTRSETVTVPADARLSLNVAMTEGIDEAVQSEITFIEPADEATVNTDTVTLYGVVKGFDVASVQVNGANAELLGAGGFSATVPLIEGANVITALASGTTGQTLTASLTIHRKTLSGPAGTNAKSGCAGCSTGVGVEALGVLLMLGALARRRR